MTIRAVLAGTIPSTGGATLMNESTSGLATRPVAEAPQADVKSVENCLKVIIKNPFIF
jgi:hypothetical protein